MDEQTVQDFWQHHACGDALVGGLKARFGGDYEKFFSDYDQFRYSTERHLPACFDALGVSGKRVLEIGTVAGWHPVGAPGPGAAVPVVHLRKARRASLLRRAAIAAAAVCVVLAALTAGLFVWPAQGMPPRVDAIVMLDGPGDTLNVAGRLAAQHRAAYLVISRGTVASRDPCPRPVSGVRLICFNPVPATTRGEAEFIGRLGREHHWRSIAVVAITPQVTRARLRVTRCFPGRVYLEAARLTKSTWPYQIAYEWASLAKALVIQRNC